MSEIGFKKKIGLTLHNQLRKNLIRAHEIKFIFWECTLRCNLSCLHCGSDCKKDSHVKDMPVQDFLKVIDSIKPFINPNKTTICLTGGEPLMRNDIEQCGLELYNRGFPWGFVTNGYLLSEKRLINLINAGLRVVTVSLDGLKQNHNWLRGLENSFNKALNAIDLISKTDNLVYDVVTCVNKRNIKELQDIKNLLIEKGVKNWRLFTIFPIGRAQYHQDLQLSDKEFVEVMDFIKNTRNEKKISASYGCEGYLGEYEFEVRDTFFYCGAGINIASILADGSISACPSIRGKYIQGNIYKDNFMDIWQNKYEIMRNRDWTKTGKCDTCSSYKYCHGNGLHLRDDKTNELLICHLEKIQNAK